MADYRKMYTTLCVAIDKEIDTLKEIPLACPAACRLEEALHAAEAIYIDTTSYAQRTDDDKIIALHTVISDAEAL